MIEDFTHWRSRQIDPAMRDAFAEQVAARMLRIDEIEITDVVYQLAVGFFRNVAIETAIARLHVVNRYFHSSRHYRAD